MRENLLLQFSANDVRYYYYYYYYYLPCLQAICQVCPLLTPLGRSTCWADAKLRVRIRFRVAGEATASGLDRRPVYAHLGAHLMSRAKTHLGVRISASPKYHN